MRAEDSRPRTRLASFTAISSPRTCWLARMAACGSPTSGSRARPPPWITRLALRRRAYRRRQGTPAYMAPEQRAGAAADARSDQFSYCVALSEALSGRHPSVLSREQKLPARLGLDARQRRALERGMRADPQARFSTMAELLREIAPPAKVHAWTGWVVAATAAVAAGALAFVHGREPKVQAYDDVCAHAVQEVASVWNPERKGVIQRAFVASGRPYAADAWHGVERAVDGYVRELSAMEADACEATTARGPRHGDFVDLRAECLGERVRALRATVDEFERADERVVASAVNVASALKPIRECTDISRLRQTTPPLTDGLTESGVAPIVDRLARLDVLLDSKQAVEARVLADETVRIANESGVRTFQARALLRAGQAHAETGDFKGAEDAYYRAVAAADAGADDASRCRGWTLLIDLAGRRERETACRSFARKQARRSRGSAATSPWKQSFSLPCPRCSSMKVTWRRRWSSATEHWRWRSTPLATTVTTRRSSCKISPMRMGRRATTKARSSLRLEASPSSRRPLALGTHASATSTKSWGGYSRR